MDDEIARRIEQLTGPDPRKRRQAAEALVEIGAAAVLPLLEVLKHTPAHWEAAEALGGIAERDPVPDLRAALPILQRLWWVQWPSSEGERICQEAIQRIETATAAQEDLPLPAMPPSLVPDTLPLPAPAPLPDPATLPVPSPSVPEPGEAEEVPAGRLARWWQWLRRMLTWRRRDRHKERRL